MNMILHGFDNAKIEHGDTFDNPKFIEKGELQKFDIVLANPPWNQSNWHHAKWSNGGDPYDRFKFGLPPKGSGDWGIYFRVGEAFNR